MKRTEGVPKSLRTLTRCAAKKAAFEKCLWNPEGRVGRDWAGRCRSAFGRERGRADALKLLGYHWAYPGIGYAERKNGAFRFVSAA
jgi:hypothetical protein